MKSKEFIGKKMRSVYFKRSIQISLLNSSALEKEMSQSILNSSIRQASNMQLDKKDAQMIPLYAGNRVNPSLKSILRSIKNSFGVVTCIGSQQFYVFTRQMLLHLDFNKALNLTEEEYDDMDYYKSEQYERDNVDVNSPKNIRKRPRDNDMDTSFAQANQNDLKNMLETQLMEIESDYELSHNQLVQKDLQSLQFKKAYSSVAPQVSPSFKTKSRQSLLIKNKQIILNQVDLMDDSLSQNNQIYDRPSPIQKARSMKFIDESFHKDVQNFKQSMEKKKVEEIMRKKGCVKVIRNGQEKFVPKNDFLRLYSSKQIGTDKEKRPIEWIYTQAKDLTPQAIETSYLLSSTIVYELPFTKEPSAQDLERQIKEYLQFYRKIEAQINKYDDSNSDMPQVVVVCPIEDSQKTDTVKNNFRGIFNQLQTYIIPENNKKNLNYFQSPFSQFHKSNSPSKNKLPPTPKRMMPVSHRVSQTTVSTGVKRKIRLEFRVISEEFSKSGVLRENYSRMREITSQGREIFNQQSIKTLCGNWVSSGCYVSLLERVAGEVPNIGIEQFYQNWQGVYEGFIKSTMEDAAQKYQQKVNQLIVGKTIISQSRLTQIHQVAKKQTMRQFSQKKIGSSRVFIQSNKQIRSGVRLPSCQNIANSRRISISRKLVESRKQLFFGDPDSQQPQFQQQELINLVESRIQEQKEQLSTKTKNEAIKWCRKFLASEYEQVKKKLLTNEIKSIANFRQELDFLRETYKKKLENHSALEYEMMEQFNCFLMENLFAGVEVINDRERHQWKEKLKKENKNAQDMELQIKQLKRSSLLKQRTLSQQKAQLQNKLQQLQTSIETLSSQLQVKTKEINYLKTQYEEQISEKQAQQNKKLDLVRKQCEQIQKQSDTKSSDLLYLQSELQKEQLLHQQTHSNYEQILVTYKNNVTQLQKKLKELKDSSMVAQQQLKNSLNKQEMDNEIMKCKLETQQKIQSLEKQLQEKAKMIHQQAHQMNHKLQESTQVIKLLQNQKAQIEVEFKLKQQKMIQLESRMSRYKTNQNELEKYQLQIDSLTQKTQTLQNQKAILQQKLTLSTQQSHQTINKLTQTYQKQLDSLKQQLSELISKNQTYRKKLYQPKTQAEVQTTFTLDNSQEIAIKAKCKNCKQNKSKLIQAMKIAQSLNQNYQHLKNTFLAKTCQHCHDNKILTNNINYKNSLNS